MNDYNFTELQDDVCDLLEKFGVPDYTEHEKSDKLLGEIHDIRLGLEHDIDRLINEYGEKKIDQMEDTPSEEDVLANKGMDLNY